MKIQFMGKFDGDIQKLILREHKKNAVKFKELDDPKKLGFIMNLIAFFVVIPLLALVFLRSGRISMIGCLLSFAILFPHELLHAICFKEEAKIYTNFKNGMLFVIGAETMTKGRFIFMSLLPNLVFGFIPFLVFLFVPQAVILGTLGALAISTGVGDYYNIFNALRQMPKGSRTYLYGFNSYWYIPESEDDS